MTSTLGNSAGPVITEIRKLICPPCSSGGTDCSSYLSQISSLQSQLQQYTSQIQSLQQQLSQCGTGGTGGDCSSYISQISSLQSQIQQYTGQISSLQSQIQQDASQISSLQNTISQLESKLQQCGQSVKYSCMNGTCVPNPNGQYSSLSQCQANCKTSQQRYSCRTINVLGRQQKQCIPDPYGQYSSLSECQSNCTSTSSQRYSCVNGQCVATPYGQYSSLSECQSICISTTTHTFLNISAQQGGSVFPSGNIDITNFIKSPYSYSIRATPNSGYQFQGWQLNGQSLSLGNSTNLGEMMSHIQRGKTNYLVALFKQLTKVGLVPSKITISGPTSYTLTKTSGTYTITVYSSTNKPVPLTPVVIQLYADGILKQQSVETTNDSGVITINVTGQIGIGVGELKARSVVRPSVQASISWATASV